MYKTAAFSAWIALALILYSEAVDIIANTETNSKIRNLEISLAVKIKENEAIKEELKKLRATCSVYGPAPILQPKPVEVKR